MVEPGMLISLAERRKKLAEAVESGARSRPPAKDRPVGLALFVAAVLLLGVLIAWLTREHGMAGFVELPSEIRAPLHRQLLSEVRSLCTQTVAAAGPLREHCVGQARFLLRFPECDSDCRQAVFSVVSTYHR
jgi:hypothetical protein